METARTRRTQAQRDATTVEIGFALFTGALLAGAVFALLALPAFLGIVSGGGLYKAAGTVAAVAFLARVARVLSRFDRHRSAADEPGPRA